MKVERFEQAHQLADGQLVTDNGGNLWTVFRAEAGGRTWLYDVGSPGLSFEVSASGELIPGDDEASAPSLPWRTVTIIEDDAPPVYCTRCGSTSFAAGSPPITAETGRPNEEPGYWDQTWTVTAPKHIDFTPAEVQQACDALRRLSGALPGKYPKVMLTGVGVFPVWAGAEGGPCSVVFEDPCPVCGFADWPEGGMWSAREMHLRAHERSNSSTMCVCGDMQAGAADPLTALNAFAPHVDRKTGQPCPGIPLPGWPAS